ncbi:hypothetical protein BGZ76_007814 [Entomortierella beljakovae]|nr:hypothetical protein BGZ76_007814 [Entomortierella beljakovae]
MVQILLQVALLSALGCIAPSFAQQSASSTSVQPLEAKIDMFDAENAGGATVTINIASGLTKKFSILPTGFEYHIHVKPVGQGDDCMATGGHLDPTNIGSAKCIPEKPEMCQEGDLSGKHGNLKPTESGAIQEITYQDRQISFSGSATTIVGRSIVIHNNGVRVACGNIVPSTSQVSAKEDKDSGRNLAQGEPDTKASSSQANNGATTDRRYSSNEVLWTIAGTVASGVVAAMLSF